MSEDQEHYQRDFFAMLEVLDFQHLIMTTNASPSSCQRQIESHSKDFSKITYRRRLNGCNSKTKTNIMMSPSCEILVMHRETNAQWQVYLSGFLAKTRRLGPILGLGLFLGLSVPDIDAIYNTKINRKRLPDMAVPKCYQYTIEVLILGLKQPLLS